MVHWEPIPFEGRVCVHTCEGGVCVSGGTLWLWLSTVQLENETFVKFGSKMKASKIPPHGKPAGPFGPPSGPNTSAFRRFSLFRWRTRPDRAGLGRRAKSQVACQLQLRATPCNSVQLRATPGNSGELRVTPGNSGELRATPCIGNQTPGNSGETPPNSGELRSTRPSKTNSVHNVGCKIAENHTFERAPAGHESARNHLDGPDHPQKRTKTIFRPRERLRAP